MWEVEKVRDWERVVGEEGEDMIYGERNNYELSQMYLVNVKAQSRRASHRQALWKKFAAHRPFVNRRCP